jgi:hypothetical protein
MAEEGEEADAFSGGRKATKRERFRDRLLKKADKPRPKDVEREQALDDFLKSPPDGDKLPRFPSPSRQPVPRINVSSSPRWPDAQEVPVNEGSGGVVEDSQQPIHDFRPNRSRRKGLTVTFVEAAPQIIGEGGDEAEAPTVWISQARQSKSPPPIVRGRPSQSHGIPYHNSADPSVKASRAVTLPGEGEFRPRILVRAPTGLMGAKSGQEAVFAAEAMQDAELELPEVDETIAQAAVQSHSHLLPLAAAGLKQKMLEEEARAFTSGLRDPSPEPSSVNQNVTPPSSSQENLPFASTTSQNHRGHSPNASINLLSPEGQSPSPSRPSSSSSHGSMTARTPPKQSLDLEQGSNHPRARMTSSPRRKPLPTRQVPETKDEALDEFRSHACRFYPLFALAAAKTEAGLKEPLSRWMRAAAWWFLTAEANFKLLRKDLAEGVNILQITTSRRHMQAVVDMAKTVWIVEDIVRHYGKAEAINLSTSESIESLVQHDPLSRFGRTLQYRQDLSKRICSLVAAVRRSGFMTSTSENVPLSPGMDSTIWLTYPAQDVAVDNWFRCAHPSWVKMDDTATPVEPLDLANTIPLTSTAQTFRMRSMFCQISGGFQQQHQTSSVPCILTICRRSGSYALVLFLSSQDHSINVVIETDPVRRDGIEWQQTSSSAHLIFADGFQFKVQLPQADYIHLKECYDLAIRASTATARDILENANLGERLIFRARSNTFERRSSERITTFPYEGAQKDCEIVLLEKYEMSKKGTSTRKAHRGFRLSVILSPYATNLGILDAHLGGDKPILLHSFHEQNPPLVELIDHRRALLNIQFPRNRDFNKFYELLTSLDCSAAEDIPFENVPLRSLLVEPSSDEVRSFLSGVPWRNVQITTERAQRQKSKHVTSTVQAASIIISAFSTHGVFSDKLLQGTYAPL